MHKQVEDDNLESSNDAAECFVAFGVVGERRVGVDPVKFNLGVHGCFYKLNPIPGTLKVILLRVANPQQIGCLVA